ncbi:MAG: hypothetical protein LBT55_03160 [Clostridiaceae bacterium]|jgi:hypothetical protein|nr:hypothetical protein [Clostridiaceae bacterium]
MFFICDCVPLGGNIFNVDNAFYADSMPENPVGTALESAGILRDFLSQPCYTSASSASSAELAVLKTDYIIAAEVVECGGDIAVAVLTAPIYLRSERERIYAELVARLNGCGYKTAYVSFDARTYFKARNLKAVSPEAAAEIIKKTAKNTSELPPQA